MIWLALLCLALASAAQDSCDGNSAIGATDTETSSRTSVGWLLPVDGPTPMPTIQLQSASHRTASIGSAASTTVKEVNSETTVASSAITDLRPQNGSQQTRTPAVDTSEPGKHGESNDEGGHDMESSSSSCLNKSMLAETDSRSSPADSPLRPSNSDTARATATPVSLPLSTQITKETPAQGAADAPTEASHTDDVLSWHGIKSSTPACTSAEDAPLSSKTATVVPPSTSATKLPSSKHKYNYASPDCGARVQSSSPQSQNANAVLHKSRDRYMLTPCKADQHWVTIELCDEIRVEAVEIAVWEYFSGVVREVKVSIGGGDDDAEGTEEMEEVGGFTGRNVRGMQTFTLPDPTAFSRFIRIDFPSYYGSEYYCPVSQIKVYGMNQLEAFKWEQKAARSARAEETAQANTMTATPAHSAIADGQDESNNVSTTLEELEKLVQAAAARGPLPSTEEIINATTALNVSSNSSATGTPSEKDRPRRDRSDSESIYAYITRRLADLEGNSTLVLRYIHEQTRILRRTQEDMYTWRREQEILDAQRWESERMRQEDRLGKIISQLEHQRSERLIVGARLLQLEDELRRERRWGYIQLAVLMTVIAIGVATRSETIEMLLKPLLAEATRRKRKFTFSVDMSRRRSTGTDLVPEDRKESWAGDAGVSPLTSSATTVENATSNDLHRTDSSRRHSGYTPNGSMKRRNIRHDQQHHSSRSSLPARYTPKKLARTAHLHPMANAQMGYGLSPGQYAGKQSGLHSTDGSPLPKSPISPSSG